VIRKKSSTGPYAASLSKQGLMEKIKELKDLMSVIGYNSVLTGQIYEEPEKHYVYLGDGRYTLDPSSEGRYLFRLKYPKLKDDKYDKYEDEGSNFNYIRCCIDDHDANLNKYLTDFKLGKTVLLLGDIISYTYKPLPIPPTSYGVEFLVDYGEVLD
jgi:hypothetical protein